LPPLQRTRALWPFAALFLIAVWEILAAARAGADLPAADDWQRAADAVREQHQPGELIVFAPAWLDPVGRHYLGDLIPVAMAGRMDAARYPVIWELAARGARAAEIEGLSPDSAVEIGGLMLSRYRNPPVEVVTDFLARFARRPPALRGGPAAPPALRLEEVGFAPHRCIRVVPRSDRPVELVFDGVELGSELVGYVGIADVFTRRDHREPVALAVRVDGREVAAATAGVDDGWVRFAAATAPTRSATVAFEIATAGVGRLVCLAAEARR
jgi:hypothetical protein